MTKEFINGEIHAYMANTKIKKHSKIEIIDTKEKSCCNCKGFGKTCDDGGAWIYCDIRSYFEERFNGDCGESKGCNEFNQL